jgi:hypothetical protein
MNQENQIDIVALTEDEEILSSGMWSEIMIEGGLPEGWKTYLISDIQEYRARRTAETPLRNKVEQTRKALFKAFQLAEGLWKDERFLTIGVIKPGDEPSEDALLEWLKATEKLYEEMDRADERFDVAPQLMIFPEYGALEDFIFAVLMKQAKAQKRAPPTYWKQLSTSLRFERYVYLCVQAADPNDLTLKADYPKVRNDKIDRALKKAVKNFKFYRDECDPEGWALNWNLDSSQAKSGG